MNASEIIKGQGTTLPMHPITIRIVDPSNPMKVFDAPACLQFVSDRALFEAIESAAANFSQLNKSPNASRTVAEESYAFLAAAVRQDGNPSAPFFDSALQSMKMLNGNEAQRVVEEYNLFMATHAPAYLTAAKVAEVRKDIETFTLPALLKRHGYLTILRQLPSLAIESGMSLTTS